MTENDELLASYLERTFFRGFANPGMKNYENYRKLEFFIDTRCNLDCEYCYIARFGDELYPPEFQDPSLILKNLDLVVDWMIARGFCPDLELFSGEPFFGKTGFSVLSRLLNAYETIEKKPERIMIPTNYTWIMFDELTQQVEELLERSRTIGMPILLSTSIDGLCCEENRPLTKGKGVRDQAYYDRVFEFNKKWSFGYHPMIYSHHIEDWQDNFLWFQEMFKKYDVRWSLLYLLEIRNDNWTRDQIARYCRFMEFLIEWTWDKLDKDTKAFADFMLQHGWNTFKGFFGTVGRGFGCSLQSTLHLRLGDLAIVPCHRTSYQHFVSGYLKVEEGKITGVKAGALEVFLAIQAMEGRNLPQCESCLIRSLCSQVCIGSNYETTGDLFSPIPTVCELQHQRTVAIIKTFERIGVLPVILQQISEEKQRAIEHILEVA